MQEQLIQRLLHIVTHPAFVSLTQDGENHYRLEMTDPVNLAWSATGPLRWVIESSYELPLDGLGHVVTFANGCQPVWDNGVFRLGSITIDTQGLEDPEE